MLLLSSAAGARGQAVQFIVGGQFTANGGEKPKASFTLPTQSTDAADALSQFQRMVEHEQWEKAFAALDEISKKGNSGFIDRGDGVLVPAALLVRSLVTNLPGAGKNAYRLFYDAQASQLWEQATGPAEAEKLTTIMTDYLVSSRGDRAADRLGDLYFERGDFEQAADAWQMLLNYCPESEISRPLVLAKTATALARAGRWRDFRAVVGQARTRYAGETVEIAGRPLAVADYLDQLLASTEAAPAAGSAVAGDLELPRHDAPAWRFAFQTRPSDKPSNPFPLKNVYGQDMPNEFVIPSAVDDERLYLNVFGVEMAFDLASGKLLWRIGKLHELNFQQSQQGTAPERYAIGVHGGQVWSVGRDPKEASSQGSFHLSVRDAATGKERFNTSRNLNSWSILGAPCVVGDVAYVGAQKNRQGRDLSVLVLNAADGKVKQTINIGTFAVDQNQIYGQSAARPTFAVSGDRVYVDTHAGALAAFDPQRAQLEWAILYDSPPPSTDYYSRMTPDRCEATGPLLVGGLVFTKGMSSARLLGVTAEGPQLVWRRPVATSALLVAADEERLYLGGEELAAYSLATQELLWATRLPRSVTWAQPLVTPNRLYQFTSRGVCAVDKATGEIASIFRGDDLDSLGGSLYVAGGNLITVSNVGVSAYRLDVPDAASATP